MNTITEGYPFCFAMKDSTKVYLYVLVKVPSGMAIQFPAAGRLDGQIKGDYSMVDNGFDTTCCHRIHNRSGV